MMPTSDDKRIEQASAEKDKQENLKKIESLAMKAQESIGDKDALAAIMLSLGNIAGPSLKRTLLYFLDCLQDEKIKMALTAQLVGMLCSDDASVQKNALLALDVLASEPARCQKIFDVDAIPRLLNLLSSEDHDVQHTAARILGYIVAYVADSRAQVESSHALPFWCRALSSQEQQLDALTSLVVLAEHNTIYCKKIVAEIDMQQLVDLLASDVVEVQRKAAELISGLAKNHPDCCEQLSQIKAIDALKVQLKSEKESVKRVAARALANIANTNEALSQVVVASGAIGPLFAMLKTHPREVLHAFAGFTRHGNKEYFDYLATEKRFELLLELNIDQLDKQAQRDMVTVIADFMQYDASGMFFANANIRLCQKITSFVLPMLEHAESHEAALLLSMLVEPNMNEMILQHDLSINLLVDALTTNVGPQARRALEALMPAILEMKWLENRENPESVFIVTLGYLIYNEAVTHEMLATKYKEHLEPLLKSKYPQVKHFAVRCFCSLDKVDMGPLLWLELLTDAYLGAVGPSAQQPFTDALACLSKQLGVDECENEAQKEPHQYEVVIDSLVNILRTCPDDAQVQICVVRALNDVIRDSYTYAEACKERIKFLTGSEQCLAVAIVANKNIASEALQGCVPKGQQVTFSKMVDNLRDGRNGRNPMNLRANFEVAANVGGAAAAASYVQPEWDVESAEPPSKAKEDQRKKAGRDYFRWRTVR